MKNITFEQFLLTYNFRNCTNTEGTDGEWDTHIVRFYLPTDGFETTEWFEFGLYTFDSGVNILERVRKIFNKEILNSYVSTMRVLDTGILSIILSNEKELDMD